MQRKSQLWSVMVSTVNKKLLVNKDNRNQSKFKYKYENRTILQKPKTVD